VSAHINVPIRTQIRYGKINKQFREAAEAGSAFRRSKKGKLVAVSGPGGAGPVRRSSYRKSLDEETVQQKALERQRKGQNPDWSVVLNQTKADPLVLVDGYNVIYKWPRLKKHMTRGDTERARQLLLEDLEGLASLQRWRIECVFDGAGRAAVVGPLGSGPSNGHDIDLGTNPSLAPFGKTGTVRTVYTGRNTEADTYIEGRCAAAKNVTLGLTTSSLIVATDDSQIKLVANSAGALCMSSDRFVLELKAVKKGMQYRVEKAMSDLNHTPMRPERQWGTPTGGAKGTTTTERFFQGGDADNDYRTKPKREILEELEDGSKLLMARYGANEILIKDNRNKKPKPKPSHKYGMGAAAPKKKKKKKKKK
jgi:predicted RNA-binding protein with PIN domain